MTGTDASLTGVGFDRPNVSPNPVLLHPTLKQWFNTRAYSKNLPGTYGNSRVSSIEGPGGYDIDLAFYRTFPFGRAEHPQSLELRIEAFNSLNHPVLQNPSTTLNASRKICLALSAALMPFTAIIAKSPLAWTLTLFSLAFFAHQFWSTILQTLAADIFPSTVVGS